jgi:hypothetical protein
MSISFRRNAVYVHFGILKKLFSKNNFNFSVLKIFPNRKMNKIACIYAYWEKDSVYKNNLRYFLWKGIEKEIDYYIIVNGTCTLPIPKRENIHVYYRENKGYDFGAYAHGLEVIEKANKVYDYYFFLNTSVRGPFIPPYTEKRWPEIFTRLFTKDVACVGTTINILEENTLHSRMFSDLVKFPPPYTHVQTMFFGLTREAVLYLYSKEFWNCDTVHNSTDAIVQKEIMMSQLLLNANYNIACLIPEYKGLDFRKVKFNLNCTSPDGNPYPINSYFGRNISPYDVIFFKANIKQYENQLQSFTTSSYNSHIPLYIKCHSIESKDISILLPILVKYASYVSHVTQLGICTAGSYALLRGLEDNLDAKLVQCDPVCSKDIEEFRTFARSLSLNVVYYEQSDLECPIEPTELCFIDSWHVYGQLKRELARWAPHTSKYIIMHSTETDGIWGETARRCKDINQQSEETGIPVDEIIKGLKPAIYEFLDGNKEWKLIMHYTECNGLTILEKIG